MTSCFVVTAMCNNGAQRLALACFASREDAEAEVDRAIALPISYYDGPNDRHLVYPSGYAIQEVEVGSLPGWLFDRSNHVSAGMYVGPNAKRWPE